MVVLVLFQLWTGWATQRHVPRPVLSVAWLIGGISTGVALIHVLDLVPAYAGWLEAAISATQRLLERLPYAVIRFAGTASEWQRGVWMAGLVLCVSCAGAFAGPSTRRRATITAVAVPFVVIAQYLGTMIAWVLDARLVDMAMAADWSLPVLVVAQFVPLLVPLCMWAAAAQRAPSSS